MNVEEVNAAIVGWIAPANMDMTAEVLAARMEAIRALASSGSLVDLVSIAHGRGGHDSLAAVEAGIVQADPTYVVGKRELASRVAASALMHLFASADTRAVEAALLVESAQWVGWDPVVELLPARATEVHFEMSKRLRSRQLPRKGAAAPRLKTGDQQASTDDIIGVVNTNTRRYDELYDLLQQRLELVDEEVNLLWWARSNANVTTEDKEERIASVDRAIDAASKLSDLVSVVPALPVALELLPDVAGSSKKKVSLVEVVTTSSAQVLRVDGVSDPLLPLTSGATIANEYAEETDAIPAVLRKAGLDPKLSVTISSIAFQVLRELSILRLRS